MSNRSGDIRDRSRKLSEIAPNFGRFLYTGARLHPMSSSMQIVTLYWYDTFVDRVQIETGRLRKLRTVPTV